MLDNLNHIAGGKSIRYVRTVLSHEAEQDDYGILHDFFGLVSRGYLTLNLVCLLWHKSQNKRLKTPRKSAVIIPDRLFMPREIILLTLSMTTRVPQ